MEIKIIKPEIAKCADIRYPHYIDKIFSSHRKPPYAAAFARSAVPGRLEPVARIGQVEFINDVFATSINGVYYALNRSRGPLVWMVCNDNAALAWEELSPVMVYKTRHIVACGAAAGRLDALYGSRIPVSTARDLSDAVRWALRVAKPGSKVLFSPGTSLPCGLKTIEAGKKFRQILKNIEQHIL